jgi:hypothetical protein
MQLIQDGLHEDPAEQPKETGRLTTLDIVDGAARVMDPLMGINTGNIGAVNF